MAEKKKFTHADYTVGWATVILHELNATRLLLDEEHEQLPPAEKDDNSYILGRMGVHNIVITFPGSGAQGGSAATQMVTNMVRSFPSIRFGLLVGVGGGAPKPPSSTDANLDIRLGDVVVSSPKGNHGGVLQYDMGRWKNDSEFSIEAHLNKPPAVLLKAVQRLQSDHSIEGGEMNQYIQHVASRASKRKALSAYQFQGRNKDQLYQHGNEEDRSKSFAAGVVENRLDRETDVPVVHYGLIASGNALMTSAQQRDRLRDLWNVSCFEMEAAGLMNSFPCVVIRGICDYSDHHKNDDWQPYAAVTAAAYAKDLLRIIQASEITASPLATGAMDSSGRTRGDSGGSGGSRGSRGSQRSQQLETVNAKSESEISALKLELERTMKEKNKLLEDLQQANATKGYDPSQARASSKDTKISDLYSNVVCRITLRGHTREVSSVAISPDSKLVVSASHDGTVRLWDSTTGAVQRTLKPAPPRVLQSWSHLENQSNQAILSVRVRSVEFSPDGNLVAFAFGAGTVRLWYFAKGMAQRDLTGHTRWVNSVAFSSDSTLVASASEDKTVRLWDTTTGTAQNTLSHDAAVLAVAFSPDGKLMASIPKDKTVRLWDTTTGTVQKILRHDVAVLAIAFSPDGKLVASVPKDKTVRLWDTTTGTVQKTLSHDACVSSVAFSPDGKLVASASCDATVKLWDSTTGTARGTLRNHPTAVWAVKFSMDGNLLASVSGNETISLVWDALNACHH